MTNTNLNDYAKECHAVNKKWWLDLTRPCSVCNGKGSGFIRDSCEYCAGTGYSKKERNKGEQLMLIVSEIAEAMEGVRKNLKDDKIPHRRMEEVELVDALIRIFDYAGGHGLNLEGAYQDKMAYNSQRADHKIEQRLGENGKKF